jgi:parvulin-like peptidyl-prolyl isomerase
MTPKGVGRTQIMKKLVNKIRKRTKKAPMVAEQPSSMRITNETVAEHRERILAGGRKFKYPLQTPKHRIVLVTVLLVVLTVATFFGVFTWSLYIAQNTSQFTQRLTQVLPYPVASVEGKQVRFSDYLLELRSALHYLSTKENVNFNSEDGKRQLEYQKRLALNKAIENAYVAKVAAAQNISVSNKEVDDFVHQEINSNQLGVSESVFKQVIRDYYDWSFDEYKSSVKHQLLRKKVVARLDVDGRKRAEAALADIVGGKDFAEEVKAASDDPMAKTSGGDVGTISKNTDDPNGLIAAAKALPVGKVSSVIEGVDGFYIVKLIDSKDNTIHFAKLFIAYTTFDKQFAQLKKDGKIQEYIKVAESVKPSNQ